MTAVLKLKHANECMQSREISHGLQKSHQKINDKTDLSYRAFTHFSENLNQCFSFDAIAGCLHSELKNIFDFTLLRFSFYRNNATISYTLTGNACNYKKGSLSELWQQEIFFISKQFVSKDISDLQAEKINPAKQIHPIDGWNFKFRENSGIIVTIITNEAKAYLPVLEPLVENIYSKLLSLKIIEELNERNNEPQKAFAQNIENRQSVLQIVQKQND